MAGEATIGAIRVILGADTAKFEENLKGAASSLESFGKKIATIATGVGIERAFEKAFSAVVDSITSAIDAADKLAKASQKFGIPVETLSALSAAASLSDVSIEQLGSSLSRLSKNMISAQGPTSEQATAFAALGISVKDSSGQLKNADQILLAVANSFSKFRDGTTKTALAVALFGRAGADLIPFLNDGSSGIKNLTDRMAELGIVINADTAKAAERFNDDLKLLAQAQSALTLKIIGESGLLNALVQLTETLLGGSKAATQFADIFTNKLGAALIEINKFVADINAGLSSFGAGGQTQSFLQSLQDIGKAAAAAQAGGIDKLLGGVTALEEAQKRLVAAPPAFDPNQAKNLKAFNDELAKMHLRALDISGAFAGQLAPGFLAATANMEALKGQITIVGDQFVRLGPLAQAFNQAMLQIQGQQVLQQALPLWDQYTKAIEAARLALDAVPHSLEQVGLVNDRIAQKFGLTWEQQAASVAGSLSEIATTFAGENKKMAAIAKSLGAAQALISTYSGAAEALTLPFPLNIAAAAAVLAKGLAFVASINAIQFAKGGSFMVPGGVNTRDNMMVPLALSGGERVDVTPSSQMRDRGGRIPTVNLGIGMSDFVTGKNLRDLVEALNQGARDGYQLKIIEG